MHAHAAVAEEAAFAPALPTPASDRSSPGIRAATFRRPTCGEEARNAGSSISHLSLPHQRASVRRTKTGRIRRADVIDERCPAPMPPA
jgi:hypothetical protein